ncbi:MAG: hypothetical protein MUF49_28845 [Oculatellaceae cyanobacterium Prado106]|nr:hypothetical protein [Oculatellaceae cyanobacterium Prado106]
MSSESNAPETPTVVAEISPEPKALTGTPEPLREVQSETEALLEAIKKRAFSEAQTAGEFTREAYLKAVRQAREAVEQNQLFDPERIEKSVEELQQEAERNWQRVVDEVTGLGDRLTEAAKAAWDKLMPSDKP